MHAKTTTAFLTLVLAASSLFAAPAFAQEGGGKEPTNEEIAEAAEAGDVDENVFAEGPIVRRKLLYRSTRFEVAPYLGFTLNDGFRRNMLAGANFSYHLTNEFGISGTFGYGVLQFDTSLSDNINATLTQNGQTDLLNRTSYSYFQFAADLGLSYVPLFGKFTLFGSTTINWDLHLVGGVSLVSEAVESAAEGGQTDDALAGIRPGGLFQVGVRLFLTDMISLNFEAKNLLYSRAEISSGTADPEFSNTVLFTTGIGIFLPGEVKVSR
jgi:outer membrane beta-barrel protein